MEVRVYASIKNSLHIFVLVFKMLKLLNITITILSDLASLDTICFILIKRTPRLSLIGT